MTPLTSIGSRLLRGLSSARRVGQPTTVLSGRPWVDEASPRYPILRRSAPCALALILVLSAALRAQERADATSGVGMPLGAGSSLSFSVAKYNLSGRSTTLPRDTTLRDTAPRMAADTTLRATAPVGRDTTEPEAVVLAPIVDLTQANPGASVERSQCVSVALRERVAYECGALRVAYPLPTITTLGTARTPTLVYRSDQAAPRGIVRAWVDRAPGSGVPMTVTATLIVQGVQVATQSWGGAAWGAGTRRQIALDFDADAAGYRTGLHPYTLRVAFDGQVTEVAGELAIVNRKRSPFGPGWWLAGYETLQRIEVAGQPVSDYFWVGGDGSTRRYRFAGVRPDNWTVWIASPAVDRVDSLTYAPDGWFRRNLGDAAYVRFDAALRHTYTDHAGGQSTRFVHYLSQCNRLGAIWAARPNASWNGLGDSTARWWSFNYTNDGAATDSIRCLDTSRLTSTGAADTSVSGVHWTWVSDHGTWGSFFDVPTGRAYYVGYAPNRALTFVQNRRTHATNFSYGAGGLLADATHLMGAGAASILHRFEPGESRALQYGPLDDLGAETRYWNPRSQLTRIFLNQFGGPRRILDPLERQTMVFYEDARFPALPTRQILPTNYTTRAQYDARGNVVRLEADPVPGLFTAPAATTVEYHPRWDLPVRSVSPTGVVTHREYDPNLPLLTAVRVGPDVQRTTRFSYCTGVDCPNGLPRSTTHDSRPGVTLTSFEYDGLGNLRRSLTAQGKEQRVGRDRLGRSTHDSLLVSNGGSGTTWRVTTSTYDAAGRVTATRTDAPRVGGGTQTLHVATDYDPEDNPTRVRRWDAANAAGVGELVDSMVYDALGRVVRRKVPGYGAAYDSTEYDAAGNVVATRSRRGHFVRMTYDGLNRLLTRITDPVTYPSRTDLGLSRHHASGLVDPYPSTQWPLSASAPTTLEGDTAIFSYDPATAQLATANNRDARITRQYWLNGQLRSEEQRIRTIDGTNFETHVFTVQSTYDAEGRRTAVSTPAGTYQYGYDPLTGEVRWLRNPLGDSVHVAYDPFGRPAETRLPGAVRRTLEYTNDGELARDLLRVPTIAARPVPSLSGTVRDARLEYTIDGKLAALRGAGVVQDTLLTRYTPLGHLWTSRYRGRDMNVAEQVLLNASSDSTVLDALGNQVAGRDSTRRQTAGASQASVQTKVWQYLADGTGRLSRSSVGTEHTDHYYDEAGNTIASIREERAGGGPLPPLGGKDRVMFYDAADQLRVVETREAAAPPDCFESGLYLFQSEAYRYDALGRRVLVQSRRLAGPRSLYVPKAWRAFVRRTVWDGDREVYEAQAPLGASENNGQIAELALLTVTHYNPGTPIDLNPHFGQVGYGYLGGIDQPVTVERFNYADRALVLFPYSVRPLWRAPAFTIFPSWSAQGRADLGTVRDGGRHFCVGTGSNQRCTTTLAWSGYWTPYGAGFQPLGGWFGSLLEDKRDPTGLLYRRNRYVDPVAGKFTQEDPIGLAGGLNAYNFADGDPVNYQDPFGLSPILGIPLAAGAIEAAGAAAAAAALAKAISDNAEAITGAISRATDAVLEKARDFKLVTYTRTHPVTGQVYSGRTSGFGDPNAIVQARARRHDKRLADFGSPMVDVVGGVSDFVAIRGREQQLIDKHGGAQSEGGTSANKRREVNRVVAPVFEAAAIRRFGALP
ncbi:MAG: hypothetical protein MUF00_14570 [Gemmatimonadaceae bacterium]|jgi:RHS repeat-associated protein|nr:hypothetical protein [Gemmatimonadaceae bacterium]